tara:strand:+ start:874 stop:1035 length:162 start_codon:yes stop_codon:yes gene_type:complete
MYSVYLDEKQAFHHLSKEEAEDIQTKMRQMISAGIKTHYQPEDIIIKDDENIS